ncbi:uncharacterized protein EDB91DRAFT_1062411 [Suillus paluster]|uniref:uncharacterized protein n=1 Tax=Suillus paluster TaxID=48578 RepID=UPI001B880F6F|nr:uncharacterized protein EDB91DRAFT_1062411 [Suillus paluster]KAG1725147.1 hypothetical protein EDB91DRAFT_1062411 [Suillus paluster]
MLPHFRPVYADYIVYEQHRHEFMNQPRTRAAVLHSGLIWRLALHSLGFNVLPSVLDGISWEVVPFGLMLDINGQTYFDDELSEEEVDFMCRTYYWPRPQVWTASGLNVGFWSGRCESWFQSRLGNIRQGVSQERHKFTNDANGPMTGKQWKGSLKFNPGTSKMMKNVDAACCSFLATGKNSCYLCISDSDLLLSFHRGLKRFELRLYVDQAFEPIYSLYRLS